MGRRHRSSSFNNNNTASNSPTQQQHSPTNTQSATSLATTIISMKEDTINNADLTAAATTLINHFIHNNNNNNNNNDQSNNNESTFHQLLTQAAQRDFSSSTTTVHTNNETTTTAVSANSGDNDRLEALHLLEGICTRLYELDIILQNQYKQSPTTTHLEQLLLKPNFESNYNSLHIAILDRNLLCILLVLKHAKNSTSLLDNDVSGLNSGVGSNNSSNGQMVHPLQLLHGTSLSSLTLASTISDSNNNVLNSLTQALDNEKLTPLQLLGKTSISGLSHCRNSISLNTLINVWKVQSAALRYEHNGGGVGQGDDRVRQQRRRKRVDSSSSSSDEDGSTTNGNSEGNNRRRLRSGSFNVNNEQEVDTRRRIRSGSFNILEDNDDEGPAGEGRDLRGGGVNNDLRPLEDVDYNVLGNNNNDRGNRSNMHKQQKRQKEQTPPSKNDYGCEVLTFGRADNCALGVPQFTTTSYSRGSSNNDGITDKDFTSSSNGSNSYKPKRVESFGLGELRRSWGSASSSSSYSKAASDKQRNVGQVDSPAVSIAASTHHTLVATRSGQLYSFGYGKGGRLGTGDENHRPLPTRILGSLTKRIVASIAAAENHSLCSTSDGKVFAWGSNGFGQLGYSTSNDSCSSSRLSPRRVEGELKQSIVVAVAASARHSVALTQVGEVYCWGDNKSVQLGQYNGTNTTSATSSPPSSSSSQANGRCSHRPRRVEGLWSAQPRRRAIAISAAEFTTLVLISPPKVAQSQASSLALPVNTVFMWGHGNHQVMRVYFPTTEGNRNSLASIRTKGDTTNVYSRSVCTNPTAIACAKYHNVAITSDGHVFTWGLHKESLGIEKKTASSSKNDDNEWVTASSDEKRRRPRSNSLGQGNSNTSSVISSPQLVVGMLPENGGGKAVAVSASESHTAIVTEEGHLFTWGTASIGNNVLGHKGVSWQPSPRKVSRVHRAVDVAVAKEHTALLMATTFPPLPSLSTNNDDQPLSLQQHAAIEISRNVDMYNILPVSLVARRLNCKPLLNFCEDFIRKNLDGVLAVGNKNDFRKYLNSGRMMLEGGISSYDRDGTFHPFLYYVVNNKNWVEESSGLLKHCSRSMIPVLSRSEAKKKLKRDEQHPTPLPVTINKEEDEQMVESSVASDVVVQKKEESDRILSSLKVQEKPAKDKSDAGVTPSKYYCSACGVSCPDHDSYTLHMNGRKHRNRLMHAKKDEEKQVAQSMMAMKRMQLMESSGGHDVNNVPQDQLNREGFQQPHLKMPSSPWASTARQINASATPQSVKKPISKSFQDIITDQQKSSFNTPVKMSSPITTKKSPVLRSKILAASSTLSSRIPSTRPLSPVTSPGSFSLEAFMSKGSAKKNVNAVSSVGASWGAKPVTRNDSGVSWSVKPASTTTSKPKKTPRKKTLSEIQQEEETFRSNEDHMCRLEGNKWFVQQRERAMSIGEIAEQEKMNALIEEQRQIDKAEEEQLAEAIRLSLSAEQKNGDNNNKKKQHNRKKQKGNHQKKSKPKGNGKKTKDSKPMAC